ncbi:hypothetical protein BDZ85DRAFT_270834 [Elsinoe ampelina]|uniref:Uncharacterized protein n=1 Tax=Elsinoe ampelina TaxID=302913 RepID=A0A6A6FXF3_9PEZI|nr:hypothetical protein BDZ85DRAFT_270834 [Elsinoe ampelina]
MARLGTGLMLGWKEAFFFSTYMITTYGLRFLVRGRYPVVIWIRSTEEFLHQTEMSKARRTALPSVVVVVFDGEG